MGFFSWRCACTGLPIMANVSGSVTCDPRVFNPSRVAALFEGGGRIDGLYDGHGLLAISGDKPLELQDLVERGEARLVLTDLCREQLKVGPRQLRDPGYFFRSLKANQNDPQQGYFLDEDFMNRMFGAKLAAVQGAGSRDIDGWQYPQRWQERQVLEAQLLLELRMLLGVATAEDLTLLQQVYEDFVQPDSMMGRPDLAGVVQRMRLRAPWGALPPFAQAACVSELMKQVGRQVNAEVISAWQDGRPARPQQLQDVLCGAASPRTSAVEARSSRLPVARP